MSAQLVIMAVVFGGSTAAFLPLLVSRWAVAYGRPARVVCEGCGQAFSGWVRAGRACRCAGWIGPVVTSGVVAGLLAARLGPVPRLPVLLVAAVLGTLLALIDMRCLRLPDPLVATLAIVGGAPLAVLRTSELGTALVAGAVVGIGYLTIALLPGRGLGLGDVKLGAVLALLLGFGGWPAVAMGFGAAHLINGVVAGWLLISGRARAGQGVPFGPALLCGALVGVLTAA
ncbi:prepilin peptidase [Actinoplanes sp. GCM10030250]|uniref:prepilin peptidase n=1 Tax=Actinoplanes sp. GCM10030250 TaxID=3273376 RepID=UPI0036227BBB